MGAMNVHWNNVGTSGLGEVECAFFECLNGAVDRACAFWKHQNASASFDRLGELVHGLFRRRSIATFHKHRSGQFIQFPQKWNLADAGFAQEDNGPRTCAERRIDVNQAGMIGHQNNAFSIVSQGLGMRVNVNV